MMRGSSRSPAPKRKENTTGYFNDLSDSLAIGDLIYCLTSTGTTAVATLVYVLSNASGVVDVSDGTTLANTDSD